MNRFAVGLVLLLATAACKSLPKQDGATLAILFDLERKLPGAGMTIVRQGVVKSRWVGPGPVFTQIIAIDTRRRDLVLRPLLGHDRMDGAPDTWEPLDAMARRTGALAAISGDYSQGSLSLSGFTVIDGAVHLAPDPPQRTGIMIARSGSVEIGFYDPSKIGGVSYFQAIGGGPKILSDSAFQWKWEGGKINGEKSPYPASVLETPQARSIACMLNDRTTMYWIHVEDRAGDNSGLGPEQMQKLLSQLKCREAILLMGGRFAALSLHGRLLGDTVGKGTPIGSALGLFEIKNP